MRMGRTAMTARRRTGLTAAAGLALVACGGTAPSNNPAPLRAAFSAQRARVNGIVTELGTTLTRAGPRPDALLSDEFSALGARAEQEASVIDGLGHPPRYNTRLRDLDHALVAIANGLGDLSRAATEQQTAAARTEISALRRDGAQVRGTESTLARALALSSG